MKLDTADLFVLVVYVAAVVLFGLWTGRGTRRVEEYTVGGRDLPWWAVLFSIVATETSTVTFLSVPGIAYAGDLTFLQLPLGYIIGRLLVIGLLLPLYFRGQLFTAYQVLEQRFGGKAKRVASVLFLVTRNLADGLRLFLTAIVLEQIAGVQLPVAVVCIGAATVLYTFAGGMRAVVWTDFVQFMVYMIGACVALALLLDRVGGVDALVESASAAGKLRVFDLAFDLERPYVLWAGLIGGAFLSFGTHGVDQMMVQRYLCTRGRAAAATALGCSGVVVAVQFALFLVIGIALWAFYTQHPPATPFASNDRVFATFIVDEMPSGVRGVLLGAVFSAAMSTLSSSLNASATTAVHDLWPTGDRALARTRALTLVFGAVQVGVAIAGQWGTKSVVNSVLAIAGFTTGIILGVFFLAVFSRRAGERAALLALVAGLAGMSVVHFATALAWPWYPMVGSLGTLGVGLLAARLGRL